MPFNIGTRVICSNLNIWQISEDQPLINRGLIKAKLIKPTIFYLNGPIDYFYPDQIMALIPKPYVNP